MHKGRLPGGVGIIGLGRAVPERVVTNHDLERQMDTSDEWIRSRTGIRERRIADPETTTSDLGYEAAVEALQHAGLTAQDLDMVLVATATPDMQFPATACLLQERLGATKAGACDISIACSGFIYALSFAAGLIHSGQAVNVLVVGAETLSKITDWTDRSTAVLFGDGAAAAVLAPVAPEYGLLSMYLGSHGAGGELLKLPAGGSRQPASAQSVAEGGHYIQMNGREVYRFAVQVMGDAAEEALQRAGLTFQDVDLFVPHQANLRIIDASVKRFRLESDKVWVNVDRYGNTSSASVPIALYEALEAGRVKQGDILLLVAFGGGLSWGATVLRWQLPPGALGVATQ